MSSLIGQVYFVLMMMGAFGKSRHGHAASQRARRIYSFTTMHDYMAICIRFVLWCQAHHGIRWLRDITPEIARAYVDYLHALSLSPATVATYVAAIRKLDYGCRVVAGWTTGRAPWVGDDYSGRHADVVADPFTTHDAQRLIDALTRRDPQYGNVALLQRISGLRILEAVHLKADLISADGTQINLYGPGIHTKGGRERTAPVLPQFRSQIIALRDIGFSHDDLHVFVHRQSLDGAVKREITRLCRTLTISQGSGSHSFRKRYAVDYYDHARHVLRLSHREVLQQLTAALGHNRLSVLRSYIDSERLQGRSR